MSAGGRQRLFEDCFDKKSLAGNVSALRIVFNLSGCSQLVVEVSNNISVRLAPGLQDKLLRGRV
jgi:uncharacterized metal-binding protein